jgi:hypothetical protein
MRFLISTILIAIIFGLILRNGSAWAPIPGNSIYGDPRSRLIRLILDIAILGFCGSVAGFAVWGLYAVCRIIIRGL